MDGESFGMPELPSLASRAHRGYVPAGLAPVTASRTAGRTLHACLLASAVRVFISPTAFEQARGGALGAGGCQIGYLQGATSHLYI